MTTSNNNFKVQLQTLDGKDIEVYMWQILQWKGAAKLELKGMKHSSGKSIIAHVKKKFNVPPEDMTGEEIVDFLQWVVDEVIDSLSRLSTLTDKDEVH